MQIFTLPDNSVVGPFDLIEALPDGNFMAGGGIILADQVAGASITTVANDYLNPEQQTILDNKLKAQCKQKASELLYATDWTTIPDVINTSNNPYLTNQAEFIAYRNTIRGYAINPITNPTFPTVPQSKWSI